MQHPSSAWLNTFVAWVDKVTKPIVVTSVVLYLLETELSLRNHWDNSYQSPFVFLWAERLIAGLFTLELLVRWRRRRLHQSALTNRYPFSIWGGIDVLCVAPFWIGVLVPVSALGVIRTLRILRLLKFFRYSRTLQLTALKFYRAYHNMKGIAFSLGVFWLFFSVLTLSLEHPEQPEEFGSLADAAWFTIVTATTVGYGDMYPSGLWGKLFVGLMLVPIISMMGMAFSAFANACETVQQLEDAPDVDPIQEWRQEQARFRLRRQADRDYHMEE